PEPIKMPIEFNDNILFDEIEEFQEKFGIALPVTIDPDFTRLLESINAVVPTEGIVIPVDVEIPQDTEDTGLIEFLDRLSEESKRLSEEISRTLHDGISNAFVALGEEIGNLVTGAGTFGDSLLKAVAGFAKTF